ncbi:MAG: precorrin-6y C5,15-methyltransferase (decarboxylating) subunit CbiE [Desulfomonilaceae bacterium]
MPIVPQINIVGCGPGSPDYLTQEAISVVKESSIIVGYDRLMELFPWYEGVRLSLGPDLQAGLCKIESLRSAGPVTVLVSGDPGFFSLAKLVVKRFGRENCRIVPGISSVHVAFSRICLDWADAKIISAHVSDPDQAIDQSVAKESKIAVLLGRSDSMKWVMSFLKRFPAKRRIFVFEDLTLCDERVREVEQTQLQDLRVGSRTVVLLICQGVLE